MTSINASRPWRKSLSGAFHKYHRRGWEEMWLVFDSIGELSNMMLKNQVPDTVDECHQKVKSRE